MKKIYKTAQKIEKEQKTSVDSAKLMEKYVGVLRGLAIIHQTAHWITKGENYYGKHLLFDRIYNSVNDEVDLAAEKLIGVFGGEFLNPENHVNITKDFVANYSNKDLTERSLEAEIDFLTLSEGIYKKIKENGDMSLGLDDMIMSIASTHETNVYLLKQQSL
jgi:DNA-binding ferritin-like protein